MSADPTAPVQPPHQSYVRALRKKLRRLEVQEKAELQQPTDPGVKDQLAARKAQVLRQLQEAEGEDPLPAGDRLSLHATPGRNRW